MGIQIQIQQQSLYIRNIMSTNKNQKPTKIKQFVVLGKIGQGSFSIVHKVRRISDGKIYALKKIKLGKLKTKQQQLAINQIRILASLQSQYIISYRESFYDSESQQLSIVMQWANEGDLAKDIDEKIKTRERIPESEIWRAIRDILFGLNTLHNQSIMHRDIKSANIFKSQGFYKLGDLNIAKINKQLAYTQLGTPFYASPQVWNEKPYDCKSDIWSFGCVIYEMCQLEPPFREKDMHRLHQNINKGKYDPISKIYSTQLINFVQLCLKTNPKERLKAKQILQLEWIRKKLQEHCINSFLNEEKQNNSKLISTICFPKEIKKVGEVLPEANYKNHNNKSHRFIIKKQNKSLPLRKKIKTDLNQENENRFLIKKKRNLKSANLQADISKNKSLYNKIEEQNESIKKRPITANGTDSKINYYLKKTPKEAYKSRYNPDILSSLQIRKHKISRESSYNNYSRDSYRNQAQRSRQRQLKQKLQRQPLTPMYGNRYHNNSAVYMPQVMQPYEVPRIRNLMGNGFKLRREIGKLYNNNIKKNVHCLYP